MERELILQCALSEFSLLFQSTVAVNTEITNVLIFCQKGIKKLFVFMEVQSYSHGVIAS